VLREVFELYETKFNMALCTAPEEVRLWVTAEGRASLDKLGDGTLADWAQEYAKEPPAG
jgi:hypothetical protein